MSTRLRYQRGLGVAVTAALCALALTSQPILAVSLLREVGTVGEWDAYDNPGAVCVYDPATGMLQKIRVRAPTELYGSHGEMTWVSWRFQVIAPVSFERGDVLYGSPFWKDRASTAESADGFTWKVWHRPDGMTSENGYHIFMGMRWYAPGSTTEVEGRVLAGYENNRARMGSQQHYQSGSCTDEF